MRTIQALALIGLPAPLLGLGASWIAGRSLARRLRERRLSWGLPALGLLASLRLGLPSGAIGLWLRLTLAVAALTGWRWHRHDVLAGGSRRRVAMARHGPVSLSRVLASRALRPARAGLQRRRPAPGEAGVLELGTDERGRPVQLPHPIRSPGSHALVVGATGAGKTVTMTLITAAVVGRGAGAVVIDPKGDPALRGTLRRAAASERREFLHWTPTGPAAYNPLAEGSDGELADRALAAEGFSEPHYQRQAQRYLGHVMRVLRLSGQAASLATVAALMEPSALERAATSLAGEQGDATLAYLDSLSPRQRAELGGVRDRLAILAESDVARWLEPERAFTLADALERRAVVLFELEADRRPLLARMLAGAVLADLLALAGARQQDPLSTLVVLDEFAALSASAVAGLLGRGRGAGFTVLLGAQELSDLRPAGDERLLERVFGNLATVVAHRQVVPASCELLAELSGREVRWRTSRKGVRAHTRVPVEQPLLSPDQLMALPVGVAAVLALDRPEPARLTAVGAGVRWG